MKKDLIHKRTLAKRRTARVRTKVRGTAERPRLAIKISNLHVTAQVIDDVKGRTLAYATTIGQKLTGSMSDKAAAIGAQIAKEAAKQKIKKVVFDRSDRKYHGRLAKLAEAAREAGLEF